MLVKINKRIVKKMFKRRGIVKSKVFYTLTEFENRVQKIKRQQLNISYFIVKKCVAHTSELQK